MFVDEFEKLCADHGVSPSRVLDSINVSRSSYSRWKKNGYEPENAVKKKIADYFGLKVHQITGKEKPSTVSDEGQRKIYEIVNQLTPENRDKLIELSRLYLASQNKKKET